MFGNNAPQTPTAFNPFAALANADPVGGGKPKLNNGEYIVEITDTFQKKTNFIAELAVVEAHGTDASPVGTTTSYVRPMQGQGWEGYFSAWILSAIGVSLKDPAAIAQAKPYIPTIVMACLSKTVQKAFDGKDIGPNTVIGQKVRLIVSQGKEPKPGEKYYPKEDWASL